MNKPFYITTTLPYINADPHIGFAMEIIQADVIARAKKLQGFDVFFNTGSDEHGQKMYQKALEAGKEPKEYMDEFAEKFKNLKQILNLSDDLRFIRTTDEHHKMAAQEFWRRCKANGDIELKKYKTKYCVGCELEKTDSELVDGKCPIHPDKELEIREEENYFFKFSKYGPKLLELYKNPDFVVPDFRLNEIRALIERGLEDFSISRLVSKMPWGVPVPDDSNHVMYVWFDALVNYVSTIGWPDDLESFQKYWPVVQFAGKDQVRQQAAIWQAMLMSAGLPPSKQIVIHGFINIGGEKMSKSIGNVVNPKDLVDEYGVDALRYYLCREVNQFEDSDFTMEKFKEAYNANLANGLGNLTSRILTMSENYKVSHIGSVMSDDNFNIDNFDIKSYTDKIWSKIQDADKKIQEEEPYKLFKTNEERARGVVSELCTDLSVIASLLIPVMPDTSEKILSYLKQNKKPEQPLFLRKD